MLPSPSIHLFVAEFLDVQPTTRLLENHRGSDLVDHRRICHLNPSEFPESVWGEGRGHFFRGKKEWLPAFFAESRGKSEKSILWIFGTLYWISTFALKISTKISKDCHRINMRNHQLLWCQISPSEKPANTMTDGFGVIGSFNTGLHWSGTNQTTCHFTTFGSQKVKIVVKFLKHSPDHSILYHLTLLTLKFQNVSTYKRNLEKTSRMRVFPLWDLSYIVSKNPSSSSSLYVWNQGHQGV